MHTTAELAAGALTASRQLPDTTEEWLGVAVVVGGLLAVIVLLSPWVSRRFDEGFREECARLSQASAAFRARWPADRIWHAPYLELEAEVQRCWQLVLMLEERAEKRRGTAAAQNAGQIEAVRAWIATVLGPLNAAAARERRPVG